MYINDHNSQIKLSWTTNKATLIKNCWYMTTCLRSFNVEVNRKPRPSLDCLQRSFEEPQPAHFLVCLECKAWDMFMTKKQLNIFIFIVYALHFKRICIWICALNVVLSFKCWVNKSKQTYFWFCAAWYLFTFTYFLVSFREIKDKSFQPAIPRHFI